MLSLLADPGVSEAGKARGVGHFGAERVQIELERRYRANPPAAVVRGRLLWPMVFHWQLINPLRL